MLLFRIFKSYLHKLMHYPFLIKIKMSCTYNVTYDVGFRLSQRAMSSALGKVSLTIREKLMSALDPTHLHIINESHMHNVPPDSETHFKVVVVSEMFEGLQLIKRHRLVNDTLRDEIQSGVHALSIVAKTPEEWEACDKNVESSPSCRGGFGK